MSFESSKSCHRFVISITFRSSCDQIKTSCPAKKSFSLGQDVKNILRCHPALAYRKIRPLCAYGHMQTFVYGESCSVSHTETVVHCLFCSPSEVHSVPHVSLQSHHLQLSGEKEVKLTYSSSTVLRIDRTIIHLFFRFVKYFSGIFQKNFSGRILHLTISPSRTGFALPDVWAIAAPIMASNAFSLPR